MTDDDIPRGESTDDGDGFDMNVGGTSGETGMTPDDPATGDEEMSETEIEDERDDGSAATGADEGAYYLIEYRTPGDTAFGLSDFDSALGGIPGVELDPEFTPTVVPPTPEVTMDHETEEIVAVRGKVTQEGIEQIRSDPNVVRFTPDDSLFALGMDLEMAGDALPAEDTADVDVDFAVPSSDVGVATYCPSTPRGVKRPPSATIEEIVDRLGARGLHERGITGDGVTVAVLDGGITAEGRTIQSQDLDHPRFNGKQVPNVVGGAPEDWGTTGNPIGWNWHGCMCATDVLGVAPDAELYDLRLSSGPIGALFSTILQRLDWVIERHRETGTPDVLSASIGIYQESWSEEYANDPNHIVTRKFRQVIDEGVIVLMAAGNCGAECPAGRCDGDVGPGRSIWGANGDSKMISVGGATVEEKRIGYSSQGPARLVEVLRTEDTKPDLCSYTDFVGYWDGDPPIGLDRDSGTSAATPIAAGAVALLKQAFPDLRQDDVKRLLQATATDLGEPGDDQDTGAGVIDVGAAYEEAKRLTGTDGSTPGTRLSEQSWTDLDGNHLAAPGVAANGDRLDVVGIGPNYQPFLRTFDGSWGQWRRLGELSLTASPAVVSRNEGTLDVFYLDGGGILHRQQVVNGRPAGDPQRLGGPLLYAPAAVVRDGGVDVLGVAATGNRHLYHRRLTDTSNGEWRRVGGVCTSAPAVVSRSSDSLDAFVRGADEVHRTTMTGDEWGNWTSLGGPVLHGVTAVAPTEASMALFTVSYGGKCYRRVFEDDGWGGWSTVDDRVAIAAPAAVAREGSRVDLFLVDQNARLQHRTSSH